MHLVTGGAGYFGEVLIRQLLNQGHKVRIFDLNRPQTSDDVEIYQGDIRDLAAIRKACEGVSVVHHNVAQVPLAKDRKLFWSVNYVGTQNLLEAARDARVKKVVYTSSSAIFGVPKSNPVTEQTPPSPAEDYGQAKLEGEKICLAAAAAGLDVSVVRPRTIVGHGRLGIFQILFEWIYGGHNIPVLGKGDNIYQFVHAEDLAEACVRASLEEGSQVYNIGAREFGTMRQTLEGLCAYAGTGSKVVSLPVAPLVAAMRVTSALGLSPLGPYHAMLYGQSLYFDISKATNRLNWQPRWSNIAALCQSYDWYKEHRDAVLKQTSGSAHRSAVKHGALSLLKYIL